MYVMIFASRYKGDITKDDFERQTSTCSWKNFRLKVTRINCLLFKMMALVGCRRAYSKEISTLHALDSWGTNSLITWPNHHKVVTDNSRVTINGQ